MRLSKLNILFLTLWGAFLLSTLYIYLAFLQPTKLIPLVEKQIQENLPVECTLSDITLNFFPRLGINLHNVSFNYDIDSVRIHTHTQILRAELSWLSLFQGKIDIAGLTMQQPSITVNAQNYKLTEKNKTHTIKLNTLKQLPQAIQGIFLKIDKGVIRILSPLTEENIPQTILVNALDLDLQLPQSPDFANSMLELKIESLDMQKGEKNFLSEITIENIHFLLDKIILNSDMQAQTFWTSSLNIKAFDNTCSVQLDGDMRLNADLKLIDSHAVLTAHSDIKLEGQSIPANIVLPLETTNFQSINITQGKIEFEDNIAYFNGLLENLYNKPSLKGEVDLKKLSLPRWFTFGRELPPALAQALNNISGKLTIEANAQGIIAPQLNATLAGISFSGKGSLADWKKPQLIIEANTEEIDINALLPEIMGKEVQPPLFSQPAIDKKRVDDNENTENTDFFDYNIKLSANKADFWVYNMRNLTCTVKPHRLGVQLPISIGNLYNGRVDGALTLGSVFNIQVQAHGMNIESLIKPIGISTPLTGTLTANINLQSKGENFREILATMGGTINASFKNGSFVSKPQNIPFNSFSIQTNAIGNGLPKDGKKSSIHTVRGAFKAELMNKEGKFEASTKNASLVFSTKTALPIRLTPAKTEIKAQLKSKKVFTLHTEGTLGVDLEQEKITFNTFTGQAESTEISGSLDFASFSSPTIKGNIKLNSNTFHKTLQALDIVLPPLKDKTALNSFSATTAFSYQSKDNTLNLTELEGQLDRTSFHGDLSYITQESPYYLLHLNLGTLVLDKYLESSQKSTAKTTPLSSHEKLPLAFLSSQHIEGSLTIKELWVDKTPFLEVSLPFTLRKGDISLTGTASTPQSGSFRFTLNAKASPSLLTAQLNMRGENMNMLALSQARGQESLMAGIGTFFADLQGKFTTYADLLSKLDGRWGVDIRQGFFSTALTQQSSAIGHQPSVLNPRANRTQFSILGASGTVMTGIVKTDNFQLNGSTFNVIGAGTVNLPKWTLNIKAIATFIGISEVPITIRGSLDNPKIDIKMIGALSHTIENIGGGLLGTLSQIITAPLKLFPQKIIK